MKITKFEHACFVVEHDNQSLIVDPGSFTTDLLVPDNTIAVVVTHEHTDHRDIPTLEHISALHPDITIIGHPDILQDLPKQLHTQSVQPKESLKIGSFELTFHGGNHAIIDPSVPQIVNLGVMINGLIYYPGDSFAAPEAAAPILALPITAPWLKISEVAQFARDISPRVVFPTHDAITSPTGKQLYDRLIPQLLKDTQIKYQRLTEPLDSQDLLQH